MWYTRCIGGLFFLITMVYVPPRTWSQEGPATHKNWSSITVQLNAPNGVSEVSALIGLTLEGLFSQFGVPESVHPVRGLETWQDDVVFVYKDREFYIYKNRVWQVSLKTAYGIKVGDNATLVPMILGEGAQYFEHYLLFALPGRSWPLMLRINFDSLQAVSAIFIYRSDF